MECAKLFLLDHDAGALIHVGSPDDTTESVRARFNTDHEYYKEGSVIELKRAITPQTWELEI